MSSELLTLGRLPRGAALEAGRRPCSSSLRRPRSGREAPGSRPARLCLCVRLTNVLDALGTKPSTGRTGSFPSASSSCSDNSLEAGPGRAAGATLRPFWVPLSRVLALAPLHVLSEPMRTACTATGSSLTPKRRGWQTRAVKAGRVAGSQTTRPVAFSAVPAVSHRFPPSPTVFSQEGWGELVLAVSASLQNRKRRGS